MLSLSLVLACVSVLLRLCAASSFDADDIGKCCGFLNDDADDETLVDCTFRSNPGRVCRVYYHATRGKYAPANNIVCKSEIECCHGGRAGCAGKSSGEKCYTSDSQYRKGEVYIFGSTDPLTQLGGTCEEKDIVHVKVKNSYGRWSTSRQCTGGVTEKIYECVGYTKVDLGLICWLVFFGLVIFACIATPCCLSCRKYGRRGDDPCDCCENSILSLCWCCGCGCCNRFLVWICCGYCRQPPPRYCRQPPPPAVVQTAAVEAFAEGDQVEVLIQPSSGGRWRWNRGKVLCANEDGSYKVLFTSGEFIDSIKRAEERRMRKHTPPPPATSAVTNTNELPLAISVQNELPAVTSVEFELPTVTPVDLPGVSELPTVTRYQRVPRESVPIVVVETITGPTPSAPPVTETITGPAPSAPPMITGPAPSAPPVTETITGPAPSAPPVTETIAPAASAAVGTNVPTFCGKCGTKRREGNAFCEKCGNRLM